MSENSKPYTADSLESHFYAQVSGHDLTTEAADRLDATVEALDEALATLRACSEFVDGVSLSDPDDRPLRLPLMAKITAAIAKAEGKS